MVLPLAEPAALAIAKNRRGVNDGATSGGTFGQASVIAKNRRGAADGAAASSTIDQASAIAKNRRGVTDGTTTGSTTVQASVIAKNRRGAKTKCQLRQRIAKSKAVIWPAELRSC